MLLEFFVTLFNTILTNINISFNRPIPVIKQIPNAIDIRINRLQSFDIIFDNQRAFYNEAIQNSGYKNVLKYLEAKKKKKTLR